jgi:hypothetical protein
MNTQGILSFGTDGEEELYRAMRFSFPHAIHLQCFTHFSNNCKEQLKSSSVPDEAQKILTDIFGHRVGDTLEKGMCSSLINNNTAGQTMMARPHYIS